MLIVRRRAGESLLIGDEVELEVLEICGSQVKLGIRAPRNVTILRHEVSLTIRQNEIAAGPIAPEALNRMLDFLK